MSTEEQVSTQRIVMESTRKPTAAKSPQKPEYEERRPKIKTSKVRSK